MKLRCIIYSALLLLVTLVACGESVDNVAPDKELSDATLAERNIQRAVTIADAAFSNYFTGSAMAMSRFYNPFTLSRSEEKGSIWMYTSAIEACNAILRGIIILKDKGESRMYDKYYDTYLSRLRSLYKGLEWYEGTYTLCSYTQTRQWTVYGVDRGKAPGCAEVEGIHNVYDDQQWLIRELIETWEITGEAQYLEKAEYLAAYVLDGWDCTLDENGAEHGGITWGPGYWTKHSCSNGPFVSPLVRLAEHYKGKNDMVEYRYIDSDRSRKARQMKKADYYLMFASKVYDFQYNNLLNRFTGVYYDMLGANAVDGGIAYETVNGMRYRTYNPVQGPTGTAYTYNSGTMLSGAASLYRATAEKKYLTHITALSGKAFNFFAKKDQSREGYYSYPIDGFSTWFNGVLLRGWVDAGTCYGNVDLQCRTFQNNLDYGFENYQKSGMLPVSLLLGWSTDVSKNNVEAMFTFTFAAEYAVLAKYLLPQAQK